MVNMLSIESVLIKTVHFLYITVGFDCCTFSLTKIMPYLCTYSYMYLLFILQALYLLIVLYIS